MVVTDQSLRGAAGRLFVGLACKQLSEPASIMEHGIGVGELNKSLIIEKRFAVLREKMVQEDIELAVFMKPENIFYFSGFNPVLNSHKSFVLVPLKGEPVLLVHCIRGDHAREEAWLQNIKLHGKWGDKQPVDLNPLKAIAKIAADMGVKPDAIGLELAFLPYSFTQELVQTVGARHMKDLSAFCDESRLVKDEHEIDMIRKSAVLADCAMEVMIDSLRQGASEAEACTEGQYAMRKLWQTRFPEYEVSGFGGQEGGIIDALNCWILTDKRIAYGCDCPSAQRPEKGQLVLPMVWSKLGGYHAENERTVYAGYLDEFKMRAYDSMLRARESVFQQIKPGATFEQLYLAAVKVYADAGFGSILPGRIGHGIGLSAHEFPSLREGNLIPLQPGMVFTVEPGLMSAAWGGVRHADTVLVTEQGYELLTNTDNGKIMI